MYDLTREQRQTIARTRNEAEAALSHALGKVRATRAVIAALPPEMRAMPSVIDMARVLNELEILDEGIVAQLAAHPDFRTAG